MTDVKWLMTQVADLEFDVNQAQEKVDLCKERLAIRQRQLQELINAGETTGDHIRDLIIRATGSDNAQLESAYRKLEERLKGHTGEFVLFTYSKMECVRHVFMPSPGHENIYDDIWYTAVGILKDDKLRPGGRGVEFPIDQYALSAGNRPCGLKFKREQDIRFDSWRDASQEISVYAEADTNLRRDLQFCVSDDAVRAWFDSGGRDGKKLFDECCVLLSKLALQPTDDG